MAEELFDRSDAVGLTGQLVRLGARKLFQELLEAEVTEGLGREPYERRPKRRGYGNGYKTGRLRTAEGFLPVAVPQGRGTDEPFRSALWAALRKRTDVLDRLVIAMDARGLSTRDIADALRAIGDGRPLLGRSSVSRLSETLWEEEEYEAFAQRDLGGYDVVYIFADAIWLEDFRDLVRRGLGVPLTVTTDGAPGLIQAVEAIWPEAERIRCRAHKMRNVLDKVPEEVRPLLKPYLEAVRDAPDDDTGRRLAEELPRRFAAPTRRPCGALGRTWKRVWPTSSGLPFTASTSAPPTWSSAASRKSGGGRRSSPGSAAGARALSSASQPSGGPVNAGAGSGSVSMSGGS